MTDAILRQFEAFAGNGGGAAAPAWLGPVRARGLDRFKAVGFPSTKDEEWRFTPVTPIARTEFSLVSAAGVVPVAAADLDPFLFGHPEWRRLVFVDGRYVSALSVVGGDGSVTVRPWSEVLATDPAVLERHVGHHAPVEDSPFLALNTAFMQEGAVIEVADNADIQEPIHVVFLATAASDGVVTHPRNLVVIGENARAQLIESYLSLSNETTYWTNAVTEVVVGANSWVEHGRVQRESEKAYHIAFTQIEQARDSHYRNFSMMMGGAIARHNLHARLNAPNVEALLYGLSIGHGDQLLDNHTAIFHDHPNCRSWEVYKALLDERCRGVFNGKIFVTPEAQKTDAKQTNRTLLLSDTASIDTKPQLEIFADDVKCTHGATVGQIDEEAFFYAQSRGVPRSVARRMLTFAFAAEVLEEVTSKPVREALVRLLHERLAAVN